VRIIKKGGKKLFFLLFCGKAILHERDEKMIEFEGFKQALESLKHELLDLRDSL
jgi:hypothetical protein